MMSLLFSLALFCYLVVMGSHVVAARLLKEIWQAQFRYLDWWVNFSSLPVRFIGLFFLPALVYTVLQIRLLRKVLQSG